VRFEFGALPETLNSNCTSNDYYQLTSNQRRRVLFLLLSIPLLWLSAWLAARILIVSVPLEHAEAIAVLSGAAVYKERTGYAAKLYQAGGAPRIVLTNDNYKGGWSAVEERNPFYYELAIAELVREGVPKDRIDVELEPVDSTYTEAKLLRRHSEANGIKSLLVVTSAYHSRRTWWTLRKVFEGSGISVGLEAVPPGSQTPNPGTWWIHIAGWKAVPPEYLKMAYYWLSLP